MGVQIYGARVGENEIVLFDTGVDPDARAVISLVRALGSSRTVSHAFITHGHPDHVNGAKKLVEQGTKVHAGAADVDLMTGERENPKTLPRLLGKVMRGAPTRPTHRLETREEIEVGGGEKVTAIPLPGHTPGTFLYLHRGVLYTGDAILFEGGKLTSGMDLFNEDTAKNRASIAALDVSALEISTVCTGHTGCTPEGTAKDLLAKLIAECSGK
jgi:glyoxylase-like metal-dependent hydrolase (beta-lactamase superfamily II)